MNERLELKKFFTRIGVLVIGVLGILAIVFLLSKAVPVGQNDYMYTLLDKNSRLAEKSDTSRIILVGGSNLAFGIDSEKIQNTFHKKVINMGLNDGLGLKFMLNDIASNIRSGDTVVVAPEYDTFFGDAWNGDLTTLPYTLSYIYPHGFTELDLEQWVTLGKHWPQVVFKKAGSVIKRALGFSPLIDEINQRKNFNAYGDMIGHLDLPNATFTGASLGMEKMNTRVVPFLNAFEKDATQKSVRVLFIYPSYAKEQYLQNKSQIEKLQSVLETGLKIHLLSIPERYVFDQKYFFNSEYHLDKEGRALRTTLLIEDLKKVISTE